MATHRAQVRATQRAEASGSGPARPGYVAARFPGATARFALFGEVLQVGLLMTLVSLPIVTLPVALAAGIRHLRRFVNADGSPLSAFWRDVRAALLPGSLVGLSTVALALLLLLDIDLARSGALPGGPLVGAVGVLGLAALAVSLLSAASTWAPETGWFTALRAIPSSVRADIPGALYLLTAWVFVVIATWMLIPLFIPALGCAALAAVSIPERPRQRR